MKKQDYISRYMKRKMKNHGLPYGMQYFILLESTYDKAEIAWKRYKKKQKLSKKQ